MVKEKRNAWIILGLTLTLCVCMGLVDAVLSPPYAVKNFGSILRNLHPECHPERQNAFPCHLERRNRVAMTQSKPKRSAG